MYHYSASGKLQLVLISITILNQNQMADLQREKDERTEKTPSSETTQSTPQGNLRKDDDSKADEKNRGTADSGMGKQDSNIGKSSGNAGSSSSNAGSSQRTGTSQTPGRDAEKNKGDQSGMKR
jgi:hypothetical protein